MTPGIRITLRCTFSPLMDKGQAGPGDPAAHRTDRLPLLPSGPGGVHRVLSHRAQPLILNVKSKKGKVASTYNRNFCLLTSYFYLALVWRRGWDSNPRSHCWDACFPSMSIRPLSHLSAPIF